MRDVTVELKGLRLHGMAGAWVDLVECVFQRSWTPVSV